MPGHGESAPELDFGAFVEAVSTLGLSVGIDTAACHHSAVEIRDWDRIQRRLQEVLAEEKDPKR